jgi:DNA processing protein
MDEVRVAFSLLAETLSPRRMNQILKQFSLGQVFSESKQVLARFPLPGSTYRLLAQPDERQIREIIRWCQAEGAEMLWRGEIGYPPRLEALADPPPFLYGQGQFKILGQDAMAVIGTRRPTAYGRQATFRLSTDLARAGLVIVSGLARGLDTEAHKAALDESGLTVAVLGSGLQRVYPQENKNLASRIIDSGCLLSEVAPPVGPLPWRFVARNRILAALSLGVLVVEAGEKSGALITADFALDLGLEVFAVPGSIFAAQSQGCLRLLQEGAKLVCKAEDVLLELGLATPLAQPSLILSEEEERVHALLQDGPLGLDELIQQSGLAAAQILSLLTLLEVKGAICPLPGRFYRQS